MKVLICRSSYGKYMVDEIVNPSVFFELKFKVRLINYISQNEVNSSVYLVESVNEYKHKDKRYFTEEIYRFWNTCHNHFKILERIY